MRSLGLFVDQNGLGKITNAFARPLVVVAVCRVDDTAPASTQSHHETVRDGSRFAARSGKEESIGRFARSLIFSLIACNYEFALDGVLTETTDHEFLASANSSAFQICQMNLSQVFLECAPPCFLGRPLLCVPPAGVHLIAVLECQ